MGAVDPRVLALVEAFDQTLSRIAMYGAADRARDQWEQIKALLRDAAPQGPKPNRFDCRDCGKGIAVDEDGCCRTCGKDATPVVAAQTAGAGEPTSIRQGDIKALIVAELAQQEAYAFSTEPHAGRTTPDNHRHTAGVLRVMLMLIDHWDSAARTLPDGTEPP